INSFYKKHSELSKLLNELKQYSVIHNADDYINRDNQTTTLSTLSNNWIKCLLFPLLFIFALILGLYSGYKFGSKDKSDPQIIDPIPEPSTFSLCRIESHLLGCGEKKQNKFIDFPVKRPSQLSEKEGRELLANGDYKKAFQELKNAWDNETDKDPSLLIAMNNAKILRDLENELLDEKQIYPIAVVVPFSQTLPFVSNNLLSGVAWKQHEFNNCSPWKLFVVMADDYNVPEIAQDIANTLNLLNESSETKEILGVIGPYSSKVATNIITKYSEFEISLVSASSTATIKTFEEILKEKNLEFNKSFFFRPVGTTDEEAEKILTYLENNGKKKFILFFNGEDAYSRSLYESILKKKEEKKIEIVKDQILHLEKYDSLQKIEEKVNELKSNSLINPLDTAIVILNDAYTSPGKINKPLTIIQANKGNFIISANNTVYEPDLLSNLEEYELRSGVLLEDSSILDNIAISTPWFPKDSEEKDQETVEEFQKFWNTDEDLISYVTMSYDATQMLIEAISKQLEEGNIPTRQRVRSALEDTDIQGLTGPITLEGSDRENPFQHLIEPEFSGDTWQWKRTN
ncbi:MAG: hypothetical protein AB4372_36020, partial [Xenococcus sp. (in: cyanobacteria)]